MDSYCVGCDSEDDVYTTVVDKVLVGQGWSKEKFRGSTASFFSRSFLDVGFLMKLFDLDFSRASTGEGKFTRERRALEVCTKNDLSGFPRLYSSGEIEDQYYLTMNDFKGKNVYRLVYCDNFDLDKFIPYLPQLADDLGSLHDVGFLHRDVKPGNLLFLPEGFRIVDLGMAFLFRYNEGNNVVAGTPSYMSPENIKKEKLIPASDVYSLGMSLYEILAGGHPFKGKFTNNKELMTLQINKKPLSLVKVTDVSQGLSDVVMKALAKDPAERFRNGKEMADALVRVC